MQTFKNWQSSKESGADARTFRDLDHDHAYSDVYEAVDTCERLVLLLGILRRRQLIDDQHWMRDYNHLNQVLADLTAAGANEYWQSEPTTLESP